MVAQSRDFNSFSYAKVLESDLIIGLVTMFLRKAPDAKSATNEMDTSELYSD